MGSHTEFTMTAHFGWLPKNGLMLSTRVFILQSTGFFACLHKVLW